MRKIENEKEKTITDLIRYAGYTPDQAIDFVENQPINAQAFTQKVEKEIM